MKRTGWVLSVFLGTVVGTIFAASIGFQAYQVYKFMHAGSRFTADDGQQLCARIADLEKMIGRSAKPCEYGK